MKCSFPHCEQPTEIIIANAYGEAALCREHLFQTSSVLSRDVRSAIEQLQRWRLDILRDYLASQALPAKGVPCQPS